MKSMSYLNALIEGQKMGSSIPIQLVELEMLKTFMESNINNLERKSKQGEELPEPDKLTITERGLVHWHSPELIQAYGTARAARAREVALSEAVKLCEDTHDLCVKNKSRRADAWDCSAAIEELKEGK